MGQRQVDDDGGDARDYDNQQSPEETEGQHTDDGGDVDVGGF